MRRCDEPSGGPGRAASPPPPLPSPPVCRPRSTSGRVCQLALTAQSWGPAVDPRARGWSGHGGQRHRPARLFMFVLSGPGGGGGTIVDSPELRSAGRWTVFHVSDRHPQGMPCMFSVGIPIHTHTHTYRAIINECPKVNVSQAYIKKLKKISMPSK